jgi:23S rRNA (uridine2552-2'-O)-methyltransferase
MSYRVQDHYFHRAKKENYLARAIYKLEEIQKKHAILKPGQRVLDLGAAPGSWMQLTSSIVGPGGLVVGVDLKEIKHSFPPHVVMFQKDIYEPEFLETLQRDYGPFDVVLSDMAPSTCGIKAADSARSELLFEQALHLAMAVLKGDGHFLAKIFQGSDFHVILQEVKKHFGRVKVVKPDASKKESKEIYILAMRFKKP